MVVALSNQGKRPVSQVVKTLGFHPSNGGFDSPTGYSPSMPISDLSVMAERRDYVREHSIEAYNINTNS